MGNQNSLAAVDDSGRYSSWLHVDQDLINRYADVCGDHNFLHVNPEEAANTVFGGTIAHGLLILSLLPRMAQEVMGADTLPDTAKIADTVVNYGFDRVRFITPVPAGGEIRTHLGQSTEEPRAPGQTLIRSAVRIEVRGSDKPAMVADLLAMRFDSQ